jgi:hypothetical protein
MPGPLQVIAVGFGPGADFQGRVLAEVGRLQGRGVLRLVDLLFVAKNEDGEIERTEGVNTRTKMIKRQMYGRAGFTLLRHRILLG